MGKKTGKTGAPANGGEAKAEVNALQFLKHLNIAWVLDRGLEEGDLSILGAKVNRSEKEDQGKSAHDVVEWASWITPYLRVDGKPVPGIVWGVSAPMTGGFLVMRLLEGGQVKATLKAWPTGKGLLVGAPEIVKALIGRGDLPEWSDKDTASLL